MRAPHLLIESVSLLQLAESMVGPGDLSETVRIDAIEVSPLCCGTSKADSLHAIVEVSEVSNTENTCQALKTLAGYKTLQHLALFYQALQC
jgi:hypothetical protein